jgi:hypothetical protein
MEENRSSSRMKLWVTFLISLLLIDGYVYYCLKAKWDFADGIETISSQNWQSINAYFVDYRNHYRLAITNHKGEVDEIIEFSDYMVQIEANLKAANYNKAIFYMRSICIDYSEFLEQYALTEEYTNTLHSFAERITSAGERKLATRVYDLLAAYFPDT